MLVIMAVEDNAMQYPRRTVIRKKLRSAALFSMPCAMSLQSIKYFYVISCYNVIHIIHWSMCILNRNKYHWFRKSKDRTGTLPNYVLCLSVFLWCLCGVELEVKVSIFSNSSAQILCFNIMIFDILLHL